MAAELLADKHGAAVYHSRWQELVEVVDRVDLLCVDAPYSERTHRAHDAGAQTANNAAAWAARVAKLPVDRPNKAQERRYAARKQAARKTIAYDFWTDADVNAFVDVWAPKTLGWFVSLTDHVLAPTWEAALVRNGRHAFSPLSCVEPGSRVRMVGDGPAQWSCMAVVARPKGAPYSKWGSLPGAYVVPPGFNARATNGGKGVVGGKPDWLLERLVEDYSRPGDLVCDPCAGAFTTMKAALRTGRRFVGGDMKLEHAQMGVAALEAGVQAPLFTEGAA